MQTQRKKKRMMITIMIVKRIKKLLMSHIIIENLSCCYFQTKNRLVMSSGSELNKEELNRTIISLRPLTEQAKVHTIHHLTKQIKALKSRKHNNDQQREQNERKVERFIKEIEILKKASKDSIGRWLLVNKSSFNEILKEETKTQKFDLEARVFSRISDHAATRAVLEKFRKSHGDWETVVPTLLSTLGKKRKKKTVNVKSSSEQDDTENESESEQSADDESDDNSENTREDSESEDDSNQEDDSEDIFVASLKAAIGGVKSPEKKQAKTSKPESSADRQTGEGVVQYLDLNAMEEVPRASQDARRDLTTSNAGKRSSFFVGGESDDDNQESDGDGADEVSDDEDPMVMNVHRRIDSFQKQNSSKIERKSFTTKRKPHQKESNSKRSRLESNNGRQGKFQKKTVGPSKRNTESGTREGPSSVHPSWEAKQKQKPSIQTFKGSKIVFDDSTAEQKKSSPSVPAVGVHPSWEAKQKQKPSIKTFTGSKIVFDD